MKHLGNQQRRGSASHAGWWLWGLHACLILPKVFQPLVEAKLLHLTFSNASSTCSLCHGCGLNPFPGHATEAWWKDPSRADLLGGGRPELFDSPSVHPTKPMAIFRLSDFHFRGCACKHFGPVCDLRGMLGVFCFILYLTCQAQKRGLESNGNIGGVVVHIVISCFCCCFHERTLHSVESIYNS